MRSYEEASLYEYSICTTYLDYYHVPIYDHFLEVFLIFPTYTSDTYLGGQMIQITKHQWILGAMRFQKIFGLHGEERHKVEKWSGQVGFWWV